MFTITFCYF